MMAILLVLQSHMDNDGVCWPSHVTIAKEAITTQETVSRMLKRAVQGDWLSRRRRPHPHRGYFYRAEVPPRLRPLLKMAKDDFRSTLTRMSLTSDQAGVDRGAGHALTCGQPNSSQNYSKNTEKPVDPESSDDSHVPGGAPRQTRVVLQLLPLLDGEDRAVVLGALGKVDGEVTAYDLLSVPTAVFERLIEKHRTNLQLNEEGGHN